MTLDHPIEDLKSRIFNIQSSDEFNEICLEIFSFQYEKVNVYRQFADYLGRNPATVKHHNEIPFLPIRFFRDFDITVYNKEIPQRIFESSGTTASVPSRRLVYDTGLYIRSFSEAFRQIYGSVEDYIILGLLPSYLERQSSSLVFMVDHLMKESKHPLNGFFLHDHKKLYETLIKAKKTDRKVLLLGVTYALLDFAGKYSCSFPDLIIMETGGMKGRREELVRKDVHTRLCAGFGVPQIHSEYGMTELFSQAYAQADGMFRTPPWMKVLVRETEDPLTLQAEGRRGAVNIIDLANIEACSFIATEDLGTDFGNGIFEVSGRFDNSDIRGCSLMYEPGRD